MRAYLYLCALASAAASAFDGSSMCVLFCYDARNASEQGFHIGRVDFAGQRLVELLQLPPALDAAGGGIAAGADDGQFFIPNANVAYNDLLEVSLITNETVSRTIAAPAPFAGVPAFYVVNLNVATDDLLVIFEESTRIAWVAAAVVFPGNGTSSALTSSFASQWLKFAWRKEGVSAVDSKRGLMYFVAGAMPPQPAGRTLLVGIPLAAGPQSPVVFQTLDGVPGTDIDDLAYSAPLDEFVASCFNISTNVASIWRTPAGGKGGDAWVKVYEYSVGAEGDFELGNADLSRDGFTFFVAFADGATMRPTYFAFDLKKNSLVSKFEVPAGQLPGMLTAEVMAC